MMDFLKEQSAKRKKILRYLIAGGTATGVNLALLFVFTDWLGVWYLFSAIASFVVAFFVSFFLQKLWTFQDKSRGLLKRQMAIYFLIAMISLSANTGFMYLLVDVFGVWYLLAQVFTAAVIAVWNFIAYGAFVFKTAEIVYEQQT